MIDSNAQKIPCYKIGYPTYKIKVFNSNYDFKLKEDTFSLFSYYVPHGQSSDIKPWTPDKKDVQKIEKVLLILIKKYKIESISKITMSDSTDLDYVIKNINKYNRRYYGYISKNGHRCVMIYFAHIDLDEYFDTSDNIYCFALGGGAHFFYIYFNYDLNVIDDFRINGPM